MNSVQLRKSIDEIIRLAQSRVYDKYMVDENTHKFETLTEEELLNWLEEELIDTINYTVFMYLRVELLRSILLTRLPFYKHETECITNV